MTAQEINKTIAEACGWLYYDGWNHPDGSNHLPDYCTDLNAMHEAEKLLTTQQKENDYQIFLEAITRRDKPGLTFGLAAYLFCHATARERAEAFLKTLGKWNT
jgi:hypothetical protein